MRRSHFENLARIQREINRMLDDAFSSSELDSAPDAAPGTWAPPIDVVETAEEYVLLAELPGIDRKEVDLTLDGRQLILSGQRAMQEENGQFQLMERSYGRFRRAVDLGERSDVAGISASYRRGVLTVRVPKLEAPARPLEIESS